MKRSQDNIEYVPPKSEDIRAFARRVCEELAASKNDPFYVMPHVIRGLAQLLELAARTQANQLNQQQLVDNDEK